MNKLYPMVVLAAVTCCSFSSTHVKTRHLVNSDTINLPESYRNRHFINDAQVLSQDPASIPGNIVRYDPATSGYEFATLTAIIKGNKTAVAQPIANGLIYKGEISSSSDINGSDQIANLKAEKGQVLDMEIDDYESYAVPDGQIDTGAIRNAVQSVSADDRKKLFYITSAMVTLINYKIRPEDNIVDKVRQKADKVNKKLDELSKNDTAKKGVYLQLKKQPKTKSPAELSSSATKLLREKTLSIQIVPVDDIIQAAAKK
ncbi:MAG: hypothetical protein JSU01_17775 [Bacteroidetes bacterium]|nr:hypothetical protein [Bacteroidota bacterium]